MKGARVLYGHLRDRNGAQAALIGLSGFVYDGKINANEDDNH
jgi:hypothetical protein